MEKLKYDLALGYRIFGAHGIGLGMLAHLTARLPGGSTFWSYQFGQSVEEVRVADLREVDWDLNILDGDGRVNPNLALHGELYAARPDVLCIAHHHGENGVALGATGSNLVSFARDAGRWDGEIVLADFYESPVLARQGDSMVNALGEHKALLLKHHGVLVTGPSIADTVVSTIELERTCGVQLRAMAAGDLHILPPAEIADAKRALSSSRLIEANWAYYQRDLTRRGLSRDLV